MTSLTKSEIRELYHQRARNYDLTANLYYIFGFREQAYREKTVRALDLHPGDTVVELCCGTGLNFPLLQSEIGPRGKILGVDISEEMLEHAQQRIERQGWNNVELVHHDVGTYELPQGIDGVISTLALTLLPEYDEVIGRIYQALDSDQRFALLDLKLPDNTLLRRLAPLGAFLAGPFGVQLELSSRHPWESMQKYFPRTTFEEMYGGLVYLAVGQK